MNFFARKYCKTCIPLHKFSKFHSNSTIPIFGNNRFCNYTTQFASVIDPENSDLIEAEKRKQEEQFKSFFTGMRLVFLGTASQKPSSIRNVTSIALQLEKQTWLFDCGEGTSRQILHSPNVSFSKLNKIFITHLHGDHIFGIFSVILTCKETIRKGDELFSVYGPKGIRNLIEFKEFSSSQETKSHQGDLWRQNEISSNANGVYTLFSDSSFTVKAKLIRHTVPCFGYVIEEAPRAPNINVEKAELLGLKSPNILFKKLKAGESVTLPNGNIIRPEDVLEPIPKSRKIVILGDTNNPYSLADIAQGADVVVHEATLPNEFEELAASRGHSSPRMAGQFAKAIGAKKLIITHFGGRYANTLEEAEEKMVEQAKEAFGSNEVIAARDFMVVDIPKHNAENI